MPDCSSLQRSLAWCQGRPELPGVKRRIYYISKYDILQWPSLPHDNNGRLTGSAYQGNFVLRADASWKFIDIIPDKSQLTSEAQGEYPSQTQLNKLTAVHPSVGAEATAAAAYMNNNDNVFLVEDMKGAFRVVGCDKWQTKTTVTQDLGQGATGSASTTINVEASDECPAPFYTGKIVTDDGTTNGIDVGGNTGGNSGNSGNNGSYNTGGSSSGNSGGTSGDNSGGSVNTTYSNSVVINGKTRTVSNNATITIDGPLTSLKVTGTKIDYVGLHYGQDEEDEATINTREDQANWSGNLSVSPIFVFKGNGDPVNPDFIPWFTIVLNNTTPEIDYDQPSGD